jgi:hypothetical protein
VNAKNKKYFRMELFQTLFRQMVHLWFTVAQAQRGASLVGHRRIKDLTMIKKLLTAAALVVGLAAVPASAAVSAGTTPVHHHHRYHHHYVHHHHHHHHMAMAPAAK